MLNIIENGENLIIKFPSKLSTTESQEIEKELLDKIEDGSKIIHFDFEGVTFICSYFLRVCLMVYKKVGRNRFELDKVSPQIKKVFMIAGFDKYLKIN